MNRISIFIALQIPFFVFSQQITIISPSQGNQGQAVPLIISGNNMSFSGWSCWSNTSNISDFRFSQWSQTNMLYGTPASTTSTQLFGELNIPFFHPSGIYNLEVFDCFTATWILFPNSFQINSNINAVDDKISNLFIYPNPTQNNINIQFTNLFTQDIQIRIFNSIGKLVFFDNISNYKGKYAKQIDLENNAKGIYFLDIETDSGVIKKKLILQ